MLGRRGGAPGREPGHPAYYARHGYERAGEHGILKPSERIPDIAFQVRRLAGHSDEMTGRLVYPDVWWGHDLVGLRDPMLAELMGEG